MVLRAEWCWPKVDRQRGISAADLFSPIRDNKDEFKATASEMLVVMPLLAFIVHQLVPRRTLVAEKASFFALYDVMRMCGEAKKTNTDVVPRDLALALSRHLELFTAAYTKKEVKPKHHYAMHLPNQIANDGFLLDCFVHERKHQVAKTAATNIKNTLHFERSVYLRMVNAQTRSMPTTFDSHLTSKAEPLPQLGGMVALDAVFHGARVSEDDVVFVDGACVLVKGCADLGAGGMAILGEACVFVEQVTAFAARWRIIRRREVEVLPLTRETRLRHAVCWTIEGPGILLVLR